MVAGARVARGVRGACSARWGVPGGLLASWGPRQLAVALLRREAAARQGGAGCAVPGAACFTTRRSCAARATAAFAPPGVERCPGVAAAAGPGPGGWGGARGAAQADSRGSVGAVWVCPSAAARTRDVPRLATPSLRRLCQQPTRGVDSVWASCSWNLRCVSIAGALARLPAALLGASC